MSKWKLITVDKSTYKLIFMDKHLGLEYTPEARERFLKDNCDKVESLGYMKHFAPDEIDERKTRLADISIQIAELEAQKKAKMFVIKLLTNKY